MGARTIGDVSEDLRPVLELDPVDTVGKRLHHDPLHEWGALGHERRLYQTPLPHLDGARAGPPSLGAVRTFRLEGGQPRAPLVSTMGPFSVIATVCSK